MSKATFDIILYASKILKNGENPIMLRITKDRQVKYISLGKCNPEFWDFKHQKPSNKHPNQASFERLIITKKKAVTDLLHNFDTDDKPYSLEDVKAAITNSGKRTTVFQFIDTLISNFIKAGKIGNSTVYRDVKCQLSKFRNGKDLQFSDISVSFLNHFEQFFREKPIAEITICYYMRTLRSVYNKAIIEKYIKNTAYPFRDYKISKFNIQTRKRAITKEQMKSIVNIKYPDDTRLYHSKNYFLFSFYNVGINFIDLALLKWGNVVNGRLEYTRSKTDKQFNIKLQPQALEILDYYKSINYRGSDSYIFPILSEDHKTPISIFNRVHKVRHQTNKDLKTIGVKLEIPGLTTYVARHSWATISKNGGVSTSVISEALGHSDEKTTQIYLESFANNVLDDANEMILKDL